MAEKGTVAAAVTQINARAVSGVAATNVIRFDRPFQYEIIHVETGLPLLWAGCPTPAHLETLPLILQPKTGRRLNT